jgi:hypothetical protein
LVVDVHGCLLDSLVDVLQVDIELLAGTLFGLQACFGESVFQRALPDDDKRCLPGVDDVAELLDVSCGTCRATSGR